MSDTFEMSVKQICKQYGNDHRSLLEIAHEIQGQHRYISPAAITIVADAIKKPIVYVRGMLSFYDFFSLQPQGNIIIRVSKDIVDQMFGAQQIQNILCQEFGIQFGETTPDGKFTLDKTTFIGMPDQAPSVLVNDIVLTSLTEETARRAANELKQHQTPRRLVHQTGDGNNAHKLVNSMVRNNIRHTGPVVLHGMQPGAGLAKALAANPQHVITIIKTSRLRGRGGAGFPTGLKWEFAAKTAAPQRYIIGNADEGEPGTFKDRVILTEYPDMVFEGMTIAGYATGSDKGILYLRAEYAYLRQFLEHILEQRRIKRLLGSNILGKKGFHFDITIKMGAGAYICGEETALINSCEGYRGDPRTRPPFPVEQGYTNAPTIVNNIETLCCAARIVEQGAEWFNGFGSSDSKGTKLLSISGDCTSPGIYEVPFGIKLNEVLNRAGCSDIFAVQVGGASGTIVGIDDLNRTISYEDLSTGGSVVVFNHSRDLLQIVENYIDFFVHESCGFCTPCRVGNVLLKKRLDTIRQGNGNPGDLAYLEHLGKQIKFASRCGLGQTSPNPILSTLKHFKEIYQHQVRKEYGPLRPSFDIKHALAEAETISGRASLIFK